MTARDICFWSAKSAASLACALAPPVCTVIERDPARPDAVPAADVPCAANRLTLQVLSPTASREPVARLFTQALAARLAFCERLEERIGVALQEAVANALVHGNLELSWRTATDDASVDAYYEEMERRLAKRPWSARFVTVRAAWTGAELTIVVEDEGTVWEDADKPADDKVIRPYGRGFIMMRAMSDGLAIDSKAHRVTLGFKRS